MKNPFDLTARKILITGASSGIGRATAVLLSQLGAQCILVARREDELKKTADLMSTAGVYYSFDLEQIEGIGDFIRVVVQDIGKIDGFVHSAGIPSTVALRAITLPMAEKIMRINFYAFIELAKQISRPSNFEKGLSIVGISSVSASQGNSGKTLYCASKAALDAAVRCMAKELYPKQIRVNTVAPALIRTQIYDQLVGRLADSEQLQSVVMRQYVGIGEPIDVANMVAYLLSPLAKFITGATISLDGGRLSS